MGEIDTKPIDPVQVGITLFDDKTDRRKHCSGGGGSTTSTFNSHEMEIEELHKELANYKVQMQAKDEAYSQLLLKLENHQKTEEQLLIQLKNSEIEKDVYFEEYKEAQIQINELETKMRDMSYQFSESSKVKEQLSHLLLELKVAQVENKNKIVTIEELDNQLIAKKLLIDSLKVELNQANELLSSSNKVISDVIDDFDKLKSDLNDKERENTDLESEINQLRLELKEMAMLKVEAERATNAIHEEKTTDKITISMEEYNGLAKKASEMEMMMRKEVEAATAKVAEFRTRAEQARARAESAEAAKMLLEEQLRKWREQKQRRKAALAALREESLSREFASSSYETATTPTRNFQPLGKVLNMKF